MRFWEAGVGNCISVSYKEGDMFLKGMALGFGFVLGVVFIILLILALMWLIGELVDKWNERGGSYGGK